MRYPGCEPHLGKNLMLIPFSQGLSTPGFLKCGQFLGSTPGVQTPSHLYDWINGPVRPGLLPVPQSLPTASMASFCIPMGFWTFPSSLRLKVALNLSWIAPVPTPLCGQAIHFVSSHPKQRPGIIILLELCGSLVSILAYQWHKKYRMRERSENSFLTRAWFFGSSYQQEKKGAFTFCLPLICNLLKWCLYLLQCNTQ